MPMVRLGNDGPMVSLCCGGTMNWGSFTSEKSSAFEQLDRLFELGINFYDTAELYPVCFNYGKTTEEWIGEWMKERKISRDKIVLATKCNPSGIGSIAKKHKFDKEILLESCKGSLKRLGTDYIDLYYLHWPCRDIPTFGPITYQNMDGESFKKQEHHESVLNHFETMVLGVKNLLDQGLIKYWALSNENAVGVTMFCVACDKLGVARPICIQNDFSLNNRAFEGEVLEACARFGVQGIPYGVLSGGLLTNKYLGFDFENPKDEAKDWRHVKRPDFQPRYRNKKAREAAKEYADLARRYDLSLVELAYAWACQRWYNFSVIIGTRTVDQVEECVNACKIVLPESLIKEVDVLHEKYRNPSAIYTDKDTAYTASWEKSEEVSKGNL
eukprot:augustus_masked-scaffold_5-processed-gene-16.27-mRNA-1 protein AED:0.01 eAED:0.01 QI:0/-1/0/1/-1/1/1/0/384